MKSKAYVVTVYKLAAPSSETTSFLRGIGSTLDVSSGSVVSRFHHRLHARHGLKSDSQQIAADVNRIRGDVKRARRRLDADIARARG